MLAVSPWESGTMTFWLRETGMDVRKSLRGLVAAAAIGAGLLGAAGAARAAEAPTFSTSAGEVKVQTVARGLVHPWAVAFLPDGRMLVTERPGRLRLITDGTPGKPITGVPEVAAVGQGGLLDVALAPDFARSGRLYLSYAEPASAETGGSGQGTAVMAARLVIAGDTGHLEDQQVILRMKTFTASTIQFGSRIAIAPDGNLFVTMGDRGDAERAQDPNDLAGSVVRIKPDGSAPQDNPFVDGGGDPRIWSKGHRNPEGAAIRTSDGRLWTVEHGARGGDEINKPMAGQNYGWPVISYGTNYDGSKIGVGTSAPGMEQPVYYWDPSIAPSGLAFYTGDLFPAWKGDLLVGALKYQMLVHLTMKGDTVTHEERLFRGKFGRIRDVRVGPDGAIYLATDEQDGRILKVTPAG